MAQFTARKILLHIALVVASVSFALAGEVIPIGTILKDANSYYLHDVTLAGTVRHVKVLPLPFKPPQPCNPMEGGIWSFYKPITFALEDDTGSIVVDRLAACWPQGVKVPEVAEGEKVIIEAQILAPDPGPKGRAIIHAIVKNIRRP
jgi:hypothetical protein